MGWRAVACCETHRKPGEHATWRTEKKAARPTAPPQAIQMGKTCGVHGGERGVQGLGGRARLRVGESKRS